MGAEPSRPQHSSPDLTDSACAEGTVLASRDSLVGLLGKQSLLTNVCQSLCCLGLLIQPLSCRMRWGESLCLSSVPELQPWTWLWGNLPPLLPCQCAACVSLTVYQAKPSVLCSFLINLILEVLLLYLKQSNCPSALSDRGNVCHAGCRLTMELAHRA